MATARVKAPPVGSLQWAQNEREQARMFVAQESEEFAFSVRNEMEWLNEHMADVFTKAELNFADAFKTPGKLRGKTPRTARKRDGLAPRQPLGDIFAPNTQLAPAPVRSTPFQEKIAQFQIAEDAENQAPVGQTVSRAKSPMHAGKPYIDSGYHGVTEDEMDVDPPPASIDASSQDTQPLSVPLEEKQSPHQRMNHGRAEETGASDESFVSAKERESGAAAAVDVEIIADAPSHMEPAVHAEPSNDIDDAMDVEFDAEAVAPNVAEDRDIDIDPENETQSDGSSPEKPFARKSSFTFSALPAREPLGSKRSMGQIDLQRNSVLGRSFGNKAAEVQTTENESTLEKAADTKLHNKTSTQLLHERISMLGKTKEPRTSKSIPQTSSQPMYPQLPGESGDGDTASDVPHPKPVSPVTNTEDDDDDWIAPTKPPQPPAKQIEKKSLPSEPQQAVSVPRFPIYQKSMSAMGLPSPNHNQSKDLRHQKAMSVSHPNLAAAIESTTPVGSPMNKGKEGPLSASKNRLWSALKSAKNIFASSASASAAAKLEAHSNTPVVTASPKRDFSGESKTAAVYNMPGALYSQQQLPQSPSRQTSVVSQSPSRKTRSSTEKDKNKVKDLSAQHEADVRKEIQSTKHHDEHPKTMIPYAEPAALEKSQVGRPISAGSDRDMGPPPPPKTGILRAGKLRAPGRLMRAAQPSASSKPTPVSVRVPSQSQKVGGGLNQSTLAKSQHANDAPAPPPKDPISRTASSQSLRSGSAAPSNTRLKALEVAARKKEADEKAAQKKLEQKKELERKRAARAEEEKRVEEERKAEEQRRLQESRLAAQRKAEKQAAEAKRREQERVEQQKRDQERREQERQEQQRREQERIDQQRREIELQRQQEEARKAKEAHDLAEAIKRERAQQAQAHPRSDVPGTLRQLAKTVTQFHINPAKPAKRQLPEDTEQPARPAIQRAPASYQQNDAKRRRTSEEPNDANPRSSVMAPPKRFSAIRKENLSNKFPHGYMNAPAQSSQQNSLFKTSINNQHQMQHKGGPSHPSQMVQLSNARIPFAENNAPPAASYQQLASSLHSYENTHAPAIASKFKTPARPAGPQQPGKSVSKSTPSYKHGDNIELPEIATDSEDEDEDDEDGTGAFRAPSWVASPALRELLTQQQLVDPESVFGPIGELKMEEVFKGGKNAERMKRFRDRGSSALWVESGDAVTSAEKRRDREARERVVKEGGWRYGAA